MVWTGEIGSIFLAQLRDRFAGIDDRLVDNPAFKQAVAAVSFASPRLSRLLLSDTAALGVLESLDERPEIDATDPEALARWKQLELLRIAALDLTGHDPLEDVGAKLSALAEDVLRAAVALTPGAEDLAVIGMGKLAGNELNYASDIDVMFVGKAPERVARRIMEIARLCFRVDANLRPEGRDGPLVRSQESFDAYWAQWAQTWEFQALLKARPLAGSIDLQSAWGAAAQGVLWTHVFGTDELRDLRNMKARVETLIEKEGLSDREVKRGRGGIRDVEFAVQLLQLVHGSHDEAIRSPNTMLALQSLALGGYITTDDARSLAESYRLLRTVEHRLQLVELEQTHTIPKAREERMRLAHVLFYEESPDKSALDAFEADLRACQANVRSAHERLYFRPLLEAFADERVADLGQLQDRLAAFGFSDIARTRQAVVELTKGLARSSNLMRQMMPLLLDWLADTPDPEQGLLGLRTLIAGFRTPSHIVGIFRDSPEAARRLCQLLGTSRMFAGGLSKNPEVLDVLADTRALRGDVPVMQRVMHALEWRNDVQSRIGALGRLTRSEKLLTAAGDVLGLISDEEAGQRRSALAEAVLQIALDELKPAVPIALIGMGRFGGGEMSYASDLDVIVVHGGSGSEDQRVANEFAQVLLRVINGEPPWQRLYVLDYDLRPEGKKGALARSIEACREYYGSWASTWERQALIRARFVAGDPAVAAGFFEATHAFAWERPIGIAELREIRHLKARMEKERIPGGEDARFNLKLGPGSLSDVEWTVQLLQLQHGIEEPRTLVALSKLHEVGVIDNADRTVLEDSWRLCARVRNRWHIVNDGPADALPIQADNLSHLARSLDLSPAELREDYLSVTRRARAVTERLFYGQLEA